MRFKKNAVLIGFFLMLMIHTNSIFSQTVNILNQVEHHYADNQGTKIHYVTMGEGPLILFVHGFPDYWYTWRDQMIALSKSNTVAAVDLRGYNLSGRPEGVEHYQFDTLVQDLAAVIKDTQKKNVVVVGHDWGAAISWRLAAFYPSLVNKLVVLSIAHPNAGDQKIEIPIKERTASYADYFVSEKFKTQLTENWFSGWVKDPKAKELYKIAFKKSDKEAMINYYKANFPTLENLKSQAFLDRQKTLPNLKMPVLIIHGKQDKYASTNRHNNTWDFVNQELTIVILPEAGHFIQQDESERVTELIKGFL